MTLYIDNRPKTFDEILGNEETVESLKSLLENKDEFPHSLESLQMILVDYQYKESYLLSLAPISFEQFHLYF